MHEMVFVPVGEPDSFDPGIFPELNEPLPVRSWINQYLVALYINGMTIGIFPTVFTRNEQYRSVTCLFHDFRYLFVFVIYLTPYDQICVSFGMNPEFPCYCLDIISEANLCPNMAAFLKSMVAFDLRPFER